MRKVKRGRTGARKVQADSGIIGMGWGKVNQIVNVYVKKHSDF